MEDLFIDDNNLLENDDITDEDKKFIMELIDRTEFSSYRKAFDGSEGSEMDYVKYKGNVKPEIDEEIIEGEPEDKTEEDILMDSIEIKNEFKNEENKLKKQVGETYPLRVEKRSRKLKEETSARPKKTYKNKYKEVKYLKTTSSHPRDRLARLEKTLKDELEYLRTTPSHPRDRLARLDKTLKNAERHSSI